MSAAQSFLMPFRRTLDAVVVQWQALIKTLRDPYRPERHYMRGPGPKWHAKHAI